MRFEKQDWCKNFRGWPPKMNNNFNKGTLSPWAPLEIITDCNSDSQKLNALMKLEPGIMCRFFSIVSDSAQKLYIYKKRGY